MVSYKVLGQSAPSATTDTTLYTVPSATETVISTITVCNRGSSTGTYRIAVRPNGTAIANQHYIAFGTTLAANTTETWSLGVTIDATDVVTVYASTGDFTFQAFGSEIA